MFKIRCVLVSLFLVFPLLAQANPCSGPNGKCDLSFTAVPNFTNMCIRTVQPGTYTIHNNFPSLLKLNYIRIQNNDALPNTAAIIVAAPTNSCVAGTTLASGASCNIQVNLQPEIYGTFNRVLQIGINTIQVERDAPPITIAANCVVTHTITTLISKGKK